MNIIDCYTRGINFIEDHLLEDISCSDVAKATYLSSSYFQKIFYVLSDVTMSDYIRFRRLSLAAQELLEKNDVSITNLAYKYGYETPESFSRAFRSFHHILPSEVKKNKTVHVSFYPRLEIVVNIKGGKQMNYQIVKDKAYTIVVKVMRVDSKTSNSVIPTMWDDYMAKGYYKEVPPMLGVCFSCSDDEESFEYGIGSVIECVGKIPEGFKTVEVPMQTYAKFTVKGKAPESIQRLWKQILTEWLPNSSYEMVDAPEFECYSEGDTSSPDYECGIWLPVKLKNN